MQARSGQYLMPFFAYGTEPNFPANTGRPLDGVGQFGEAWRPDVNGDPNVGGTREQFFNLGAYRFRRRARSAPRRKAACWARARGW